jgi:hypothetical protein
VPDQSRDREAIREVVLRYCHGIDRLDAECMRSAYWPEATDDHGKFVGLGWDFVDHCMVSHLRWRSTMHCIFNHWIEFPTDGPGGHTATGEAYNVTYLFPRDLPGMHLWCGRYLDSYEKRGDEWRILHRVCVHEGTVVTGAPAMAFAAADYRQGSADRPTVGRSIGT